MTLGGRRTRDNDFNGNPFVLVHNSGWPDLRTEGAEMTHQRQWFSGVFLGAILLIPGSAAAQDTAHKQTDSAAPANPDSTKPGAPQASLAKLAGDYARVIKFVGPAGAGIAPSPGTAKISVVLGGRFILEESTDTVMGRTVDGLRLYGYNNATQQYEMARMYTMSTAITMMTGTSTDGGKTINFAGTTDTSAKGAAALHAEFRVVSDDQFVVTLSTTAPDGKEEPFQETDYKRKK
jgi:hypothetical protein